MTTDESKETFDEMMFRWDSMSVSEQTKVMSDTFDNNGNLRPEYIQKFLSQIPKQCERCHTATDNPVRIIQYGT